MRAATPAAIRGSGKRVARSSTSGLSKPRTQLPWQERALAYYDMVGEIHYAAQFYARPLSRIKLGVGYKDPVNGQIDQIESGPAVELLDRVQDPEGGRAGILGAYGQLIFVTGECYLLNTVTDGVERWEIVSTDELKPNGDGTGYLRRKVPGQRGEELRAASDEDYEPLDDEAIAYRLWRRHPRYSGWPDSPMRAVLDIAEELVMLTLAVRARARSRLAQSGILYVPNEISPPPATAVGDEDAVADPFIEDLTEHFVTPIEDEGTAAAVVPYIVRGPAKIGDVDAKNAFFHVQTHQAEESYPEAELRREAVGRLAMALDMPREALEGKGQANHWTAWLLSDEEWQTIAPIAQQFVDDLTAVYLRPAALEAGIERAEDLVVTFDAAEILTDPDRGKDAESLFDRRAIGKKALRDAHGFEDSDAPTPEELDEILAVQLRDAALIGGDGGEEEEPVAESPGPARSEEDPEREEVPIAASAGTQRDTQRILGAAEMTLYRCRELAGSRLRSKNRNRPELRVGDGIANAHLAAALGAVTLEALGADPVDLVSDGASGFAALLTSWGYSDREAVSISAMLESYAARTLFEETTPAVPAGVAGFLLRGRS